MAKSKSNKGGIKEPITSGIVASNRRASHKYEFLEKIECGIQLRGSEVKSLRQGAAQLCPNAPTHSAPPKASAR
jgi:SsrA-binding protein